ncbi:hypothetical protein DPSP01_000706 [Paraphaeosphaeria sporulosa]|uniref:SGF29 C-terminal domain-containing protein n=1 Tax=Paraphaeosphaeria sporulosa TaxID=1460663 RepID=A0A177CPW5_9PLEO|nr:uncharacterized protein CC84DRAFT_1160704 [Paraphaeosphaeria sporulosa]OAG09575.1 hypothetical protein CC84DRAFT_1160704 [Paraphaeosphaeria sporulosa]
MAARSRPRGGQMKDEIDEERHLWNTIRADGRRFDQLMAQSDTLQEKILELAGQQEARKSRGDAPSSRIDNELDAALRENIKLSEEMLTLIKSDQGNDICEQLTVLSALRSADTDSSTSRATNPGKSRDRGQNKRKLTDAADDRDSIAADSPAVPSPKVVLGKDRDRLLPKSGSSRAGSVPAGRESSVKVEDEKDDVKETKQRLTVHTEVLYRAPRSRSGPIQQEGEGTLHRITSVIGEGKQRRYEIIDSDPDPLTPSIPFRASVATIVPIPPAASNLSLPSLEAKKNVLALYPGTTTFYKAEVVDGWKSLPGGNGGGKDGIKKEGGAEEKPGKEAYVTLRFEGEDEVDMVNSVERRYVLPDKA